MRVLVVEDCRPLADLVARGLSTQGIAADVAYNGATAADKLSLNTYDVVVLDRTLPGISGDTICQTVTAAEERPMVLMLSAAADPDERTSGLAFGADDYLAKPLHFPELILRVRALARRQPRAQPRILRAGGLQPDRPARRATLQGDPLDLSTKELALLETLMNAYPAYLSAEQLLEKVWDENADPFTKTVTVTISRLRHKLGEPGVLETAVRRGYRITNRPEGRFSGTSSDRPASPAPHGRSPVRPQHQDRR